MAEIMSDAQRRALEIYIDGADEFNDFKHTSFEDITRILKKEGFQCSSSTVQRWSVRFKFKEHLELHLKTILIDEKKDLLVKKATSKAAKKTIVDLERNNQLTAKGYGVLEVYLDDLESKCERGYIPKQSDIKLVTQIVSFSAGREDKMFDRIALAGGNSVNPDDILEEFDSIDVDVEENDFIEADIE